MSDIESSFGSLSACKWGWCRETFESQVKLAKHVLDVHIANAKPIRRDDLKLDIRARDGTSYEGI